MKNFYLFIIFSLLTTQTLASTKKDIIKNLQKTNNLSFNFEQNINGKIELGSCVIEYPKKMFCKYNNINKKVLVSNGKSLVIKTKSGSYYRYSIKSTPLNYILDKNFLIKEIRDLKERVIDNKFVNFKFFEEDFEVNIFFDYKTLNLIGWQTKDIYQNLSITFLDSVKRNQKLNSNLFNLPQQN